MLATVALCSCTDKNEDKTLDQAVLGSWIGYNTYQVEEGTVNPNDNNPEACWVYLTFKSDNTCSIYIPHWWEIRRGTYTVQDNNKSTSLSQASAAYPTISLVLRSTNTPKATKVTSKPMA